MRTLLTAPRSERRSRSDVVATSPRGASRHWQIGPRIRIGGSVGKVGQNVKNAVVKGVTDEGHFIGKVADNKYAQMAALAALTATGVGAGPAAALMATMKGGGALLKPGGNIGAGLKEGAIGAAEGYGASKLGSFGRSLLASKFGGGSADGDVGGSDGEIPGLDASGNPVDPSTGLPVGGGDSSGGGFLDGAKRIGGKLLGYGKNAVSAAGGGGSALNKALMAAMIADAAARSKRQKELQDKGLAFATDSYSARQPLRQQGLSMLQTQHTPDLSFMNNSANPYTRPVTSFNPSAKTPILPSGGTY